MQTGKLPAILRVAAYTWYVVRPAWLRKQQKHPHHIKQAPNSPVKLPPEELENSVGGFNCG